MSPSAQWLHSRFDAAKACFDVRDNAVCWQLLQQLLALAPDYVAGWYLLGQVELRLGHYPAAIKAFEQVLARHCGDIESLNGVAFAHYQLGQEDESLTYYEQILEREPRFLPALQALGTLYAHHGQTDEALYYFEQVASLAPEQPGIKSTLAHLYYQNGQWSQTFALLQERYAMGDMLASDCYLLGELYRSQGKVAEASDVFQWGMARYPDDMTLHQGFWVLVESLPQLTEAEKFQHYCAWSEHFAAGIERPPHYENSAIPDKKLKVGYVAADFKLHSALHDFLYLFHHMDREHFEVFIYADNPMNPMAENYILPFVDHWYEIMALDDEAVATMIRQQGIDILVNISACRLLVFARKPAPVQIAGFGLGNTTGLKTMDYLIADPQLIPPENAAYLTEKLYYLSTRMHWYYRTDDLLKATLAQPPCLKQPYVTFGSGNNSFKLNSEVVACWAELLHQVPQSRLALKFPSFGHALVRDAFITAFGGHGIPAERLRLQGSSTLVEHLQFYNTVDIVLDPFPYQGGVSSLDALWMGCPVVTLNRGIRTGASILTALGHPEWIATTPAEYVGHAIHLAQQPTLLAHLKQSLRQELQQSPLCDGVTYTHEVEALYRQAWQEWCAQAVVNS